MGDFEKFQTEWSCNDNDDKDATVKRRTITDRQDNNVLHALFSCRVPNAPTNEILEWIHDDDTTGLDSANLSELYHAPNHLGCTPLWILVAYGNVPLLKQVQAKLSSAASNDTFADMLRVPNLQGDSPLLATCS